MAEVNQQAIEEMKFYFEEVGVLTDSGYQVNNPELLKERAESEDESAAAVYELYLENLNKESSEITTQNVVIDYAKCIVEEVAGQYVAAIELDIAKALIGAIEDGLWTEAVLLLAQITGLSVGSVAMAALVAQIAAASITCGIR